MGFIDQARDFLVTGLVHFITAHPWLSVGWMIGGGLRMVFKPIDDLLHYYVSSTPEKTDDAILNQFESSLFVKCGVYLVDWLCSVKLKRD